MTIELMHINSMPLTRVPLSQLGPRAIDAYGRDFPAADELAEMPEAMRVEAALLAAEAGRPFPHGALHGGKHVEPWRPARKSFSDAHYEWQDSSPQASILASFIADCLRFTDPNPAAWVPAEDVFALYAAWCKANGHAPLENRFVGQAIGSRVTRFRRCGETGYLGLAWSETAPFYRGDLRIVPDEETVMAEFTRDCLATPAPDDWLPAASIQAAFQAWCAMKRWPRPQPSVYQHALRAMAEHGRDAQRRSGFSGLRLTPLGAALSAGAGQ